MPRLATSLARLQQEDNLGDLQRAMFALRDEAVAIAPRLLIDKVDALGSREQASGSNVSYDREVIASFLDSLTARRRLKRRS